MRGDTGAARAVLAPLLSRGRKAKCPLLGFPAGKAVAPGRAAARCSSWGCARASRGPPPPAAGCSNPGLCPLGEPPRGRTGFTPQAGLAGDTELIAAVFPSCFGSFKGLKAPHLGH